MKNYSKPEMNIVAFTQVDETSAIIVTRSAIGNPTRATRNTEIYYS